jgi:hypothetical protein
MTTTRGARESPFREMPGAPNMPILETPQLVLRALDDFPPRRSGS